MNEERDLNRAKALFEDAQDNETDPEMVALAVQLIDRQTSAYDPSETEDRYETRLRAMIEAKLKGEGALTAAPKPRARGQHAIGTENLSKPAAHVARAGSTPPCLAIEATRIITGSCPRTWCRSCSLIGALWSSFFVEGALAGG